MKDPAAAPQNRFRAITILSLIAIVGFAAIQTIRPKLDNPPVTADLKAPPEVKQILRNSCYNCHSNETNLPWFDRVAPAYWLVTNDVKEARKHLNFSELGKVPVAQQNAALYEAVYQIQMGEMPLKSYRLVHRGAIVTPEQVAILKNYLNPPAPTKVSDPAVKLAADAEYERWIHASTSALNVHPAPNGIEYIPDYKNWKVLSTTERFDNHTMRVIFGNDVAIKAVAENHINPWPDGTVFAKTAWAQQVEENGDTKTGAFVQVEFMIKDSRKYASTKGWGWGRWRGDDLKPYGKDAGFTSECVGCHNPLRKNDYVFSFPLTGQK